MNYEKFVKEVKRGVEDIVEKELGEGVVVVRNVLKNNNVRRKAISIVRKEEVATPTIYLRNYFVDFKHGRDMTNICTEIFNMYLYSMDSFNADIDLRDIADFEKVKTMIHYKLINYEMNKELLNKVPYLKFLDLAIVFYIMVSEDGEGQATALIHKEHLEGWGISRKELRDIAFKNTWDKFPVVVTPMEDIISDMILKDISGIKITSCIELGIMYTSLSCSLANFSIACGYVMQVAPFNFIVLVITYILTSYI